MRRSPSRSNRSREGLPVLPIGSVAPGFPRIAKTSEQGLIDETMHSSLSLLVSQRGWNGAFVGSYNYFAWKKGVPSRHVLPDVYLLDDHPDRLPDVWRTWLPRNPPPRWALEVVFEGWFKDYVLDPGRYEELGCPELVVFDTDAARGASRPSRREPLTVYRRTTKGRLELVEAGEGPSWSQQLEVWMIVVREGDSAMLRLSEGPARLRLIPTAEESNEALRRELEAQRASFERALGLQKAARDKERAALEREVGELKAQLEKAQAKTAPTRPRRGRKPKPGGQ